MALVKVTAKEVESFQPMKNRETNEVVEGWFTCRVGGITVSHQKSDVKEFVAAFNDADTQFKPSSTGNSLVMVGEINLSLFEGRIVKSVASRLAEMVDAL